MTAYNRQSVDECVADAVGGHVDAHEQDCITHPATGELLIEEGALRPGPRPYLPPLGDGQPRQPYFWEQRQARKAPVERAPVPQWTKEAVQPVYADNVEASGLVEAAEAKEEMQAVAAAVRQVAPEQRGAFGEKLRSALGRIVKRLQGGGQQPG